MMTSTAQRLLLCLPVIFHSHCLCVSPSPRHSAEPFCHTSPAPCVSPAVDIAVPSKRLAIEVDGPTHFCRNAPPASDDAGSSSGSGSGAGASEGAPPPPPRLPTGGTLLKRRLLRLQGWAVASVCVEDWEQLRGPQAKRRYLAAAIAAANAEAAADVAPAAGG